MTHATLWFDGASKGNPGQMGAGAILQIDGRRERLSQFLGHGTNNEAEYRALIIGLQRALERGATSVTVRGDSDLVIKQMMGSYAVRAANLRPLNSAARSLAQGFRSVQYAWLPREQNAEADAAANEAVVGHR